jgi:hypothetical protein
MKFPYLSQWDNAVCKVSITDTKPSENGDFPVIKTYEGKCNLSEKARTVRSVDGEYVRLNCVLHIQGDIAPDLASFTGKATVNGREMLIETVDRPRNPDGSVHHTRLGLI